MAAPVSLTTIAALALAGVGTGLYLGKSAVAEIDPSYFSSPYEGSSKFYADLVPGGAKFDPQPAQLQDASFAGGLGSGCVLCPKAEEIYAYSPDGYAAEGEDAFIGYASYVEFPAEDVVTDAEDAVEEAARLAAIRTVERYAHFPVSAEEEAADLAETEVLKDDDRAEVRPASIGASALAVDGETTPGI